MLLWMLALALPLCAVAAEADRAAASWVLRLGGSVRLHGGREWVRDLAQLPAGDIRVHTVNLVPLVVEPAEFERLSGLPDLRELFLSGRTWHSLSPRTARDSFRHLAGLTSLERPVLSLPVQTDVQLEDDAIEAIAPLVNLRELRLA